MRSKRLPLGLTAVLAIFAFTMLTAGTRAAAQQEKVLHSFNNNGTDGTVPYVGLIGDVAGNFYGATDFGGIYNAGTVFELKPKSGGGWIEKVLYTFGFGGANPRGGLIFDAAGNLYGTTNLGGAYGCGTVFELTPSTGGVWTETLLHSFNNDGTDACYPFAGLTFDAAGNLYGTTSQGGAYGFGAVFQVTPATGGGWTEKVLHSFNNDGTDGYHPFAGLVLDGAGNLYGTTTAGGTHAFGIVFELTPSTGGNWTETVLHVFNPNGPDGLLSYAGLILDAGGNLYGTTTGGGTHGDGAVFELTPLVGGGWKERVLHNFGSGKDGQFPQCGLVFDSGGNLYGTTYGGGAYNFGTVFKLTPITGGGWTPKVLHNFNSNAKDGFNPYASLALDALGNLYGTTYAGGVYGYGTVFQVKP